MSESTASNTEHDSVPERRRSPGLLSPGQDLVQRVSSLIGGARESIASYANATLTVTYWQVGAIIDSEVLGASGRAEYGAQTLVTLSQELTARFGRGFDEPNLNRMVKFARLFPDREIVVTLSQRLSWSHFLALLPLGSDDAQAFYAQEAVAGRWTVRELRRAIARKAYERREIADSQIGTGRWFRPTPSATRTYWTSSVFTTATSKLIWRRRSYGTWRRSCWRLASVLPSWSVRSGW